MPLLKSPGSHASIEKSIRALEATLRLSITIIDHAGIFHTPRGVSLFPPRRQTHQKNEVCAAGFQKKCIDHCRDAMNAKCQKVGGPFVETCWKGVVEVVVPLADGGVHYGMLYAGSWKNEQSPPHLSEVYGMALNALPLWHRGNQNLLDVLSVFADGLVARLKKLNALSTLPNSRGNVIRAHIRAHAPEPISLGDIARLLGLSLSRTSAVIQDTTGSSLPALLTGERIARVKALLTSTENSLAHIAEVTGFCDPYHLSKTFSKIAGLNPREYRRLNKPRLEK